MVGGLRPVKICIAPLGPFPRERDAGDADQDALERPAVSLDPLLRPGALRRSFNQDRAAESGRGASPLGQLDLYVYTCGEIELH